MCTEFISLQMASFCDNNYEISGALKCGKFLDLTEELIKKDVDPWS
jgi:hypothetical protein